MVCCVSKQREGSGALSLRAQRENRCYELAGVAVVSRDLFKRAAVACFALRVGIGCRNQRAAACVCLCRKVSVTQRESAGCSHLLCHVYHSAVPHRPIKQDKFVSPLGATVLKQQRILKTFHPHAVKCFAETMNK